MGHAIAQAWRWIRHPIELLLAAIQADGGYAYAWMEILPIFKPVLITGKLLVNMKIKISLQCPGLSACLVVFLKKDILYREGSEMGGPDGDEMFACVLMWYGYIYVHVHIQMEAWLKALGQ